MRSESHFRYLSRIQKTEEEKNKTKHSEFICCGISRQLSVGQQDATNKSERCKKKRGRGSAEGVTPPSDQRPSSSLLSFLQFVNFCKSRVGSAQLVTGPLFASWDFGASGVRSTEETPPHTHTHLLTLELCFMECLWKSFTVIKATR